MDVLVHNCVLAAQKCYSCPGDVSAAHLENKLESLNASISDRSGAHKLSVSSLQVCELLNLSSHLLPASHTPSSLRAKLYSFLYNIAWFNIPVRSYMAGELQMCNMLYEFLKFSLRNEGQGGPRCLVQSLQLMQVLTYDHRVVVGPSWTQDLVGFLINEICRDHETQWMPYCIGILNNLCTNVPVVRDQIRRNESVNSLYRRLINFLSHQSTSVVICSLSLVSYLEEKLRNTVFSSRNLPQTFQCLFNVLVKGDKFMCKHTAVDLMRRLVGGEGDVGGGHRRLKLSCESANLSSFERALLDFKGLDRSLEQVATLLVELESLDFREQLSKVYDLLLTFCSVEALKQRTCAAIMNSAPIDPNRLTTPILACLQHSSIQVEEDSPFPEVTLKAMQLLKLVLEDDEMRNDLLDNVTAPLCAHMAEFQMLSNPVAFKAGGGSGTNFRGSHSSLSSRDALPSWSGAGVEILLELLQLLASLKDHSYPHKQQYWKLLKDERMLPFLAFGINSGKKEIVHGSLQLILHCSQVHQFPLLWLSELVAWNSGLSSETGTASPNSSEAGNGHSGGIPLVLNGLSSANFTPQNVDEEVVDELIEKMKNKLDLQDPRMSQMITVYEKKINSLLSKERQLEELLQSKQGLLMQHERLISQYRAHKEQGEQELSKLRSLIREGEEVSEKTESKIVVLQEERDTLRTHLDTAERTILGKKQQVETLSAQIEESQAKVENLMKALEVSKKDIESEREMQDILRRRYNEMKNNFDTTSQKLFDVEEELKRTRNHLHEKEVINSKLETNIAKKEEIVANMEKNMHKQTENLRRIEEERRNLLKQLDDKNEKVKKLDSDLKEQKKLIDMIGRMTTQNHA